MLLCWCWCCSLFLLLWEKAGVNFQDPLTDPLVIVVLIIPALLRRLKSVFVCRALRFCFNSFITGAEIPLLFRICETDIMFTPSVVRFRASNAVLGRISGRQVTWLTGWLNACFGSCFKHHMDFIAQFWFENNCPTFTYKNTKHRLSGQHTSRRSLRLDWLQSLCWNKISFTSGSIDRW